ncbi:MAG: hypothetical protein QOH95_2186 [Gaiellaceae bacterium]|nr:hypothetical protein [Gaiellaceae bacterium]
MLSFDLPCARRAWALNLVRSLNQVHEFGTARPSERNAEFSPDTIDRVIAAEPFVSTDELQRRTGWAIEPQGACKGEVCVPLEPDVLRDGKVDLHAFAQRLGMPLVHDGDHGLWALGPESLGGRALTTTVAPELVLPDLDGKPFAHSSLRGRKVVLTAWASW